MWAIHSHNLAHLPHMTPIKVKFKWTKIEQDTLEEIKCIVYRSDFITKSYQG